MLHLTNYKITSKSSTKGNSQGNPKKKEKETIGAEETMTNGFNIVRRLGIQLKVALI